MAFIKTQTTHPVTEDERQQSRDCASLIAELENVSPMVRRWASRDLTDFPAASSALVNRLQREEDVSVREVILTTLTSLGDEVAVAGLVECLRSEETSLRNEAIEAMKQLPNKVAPIMRGLLTDDDADVRIFAVNILESLRHPEVESWLISVIENDQHLNVCATAVDLLGEVGSSAAREPLLHLKARYADEPYIQFATDLALKRINEG
jgi:HEAT repeat protein